METVGRVSIKAIDEILGKPFKVLDDGFVRVIDYMGSDSAIVQAARVSYGEGTQKLHEDRGLIRYLMRHNHTTPFEMCEIKLHVRVPMDCWRQWIRHRTANVNEYSTRYSVAIDSAQKTPNDEWRLQSKSNKQGSSEFLNKEDGSKLTNEESEFHDYARKIYKDRLEKGIAREQARKDLPLSTYTEAYWKVDLHNLLHFLSLRMDSHAQAEIRSYATLIGGQIVSQWCPLAWEAFLDYKINSISFSSIELKLISLLTTGKTEEAIALAKEYGLLSKTENEMKRNRERNELEFKLDKLNIRIPWK